MTYFDHRYNPSATDKTSAAFVIPPLTQADHDRVAADVTLWQSTKDNAARDRIFTSVRPMLSYYSRRLCPPGLEPNDLEQELAFAVYDALRGFRADAGTRFSSFLVPWIMKRAHNWRDRERLIYVPAAALLLARSRGGGAALIGPAESGAIPWCEPVGLDGGSGDSPSVAAGGNGAATASRYTGRSRSFAAAQAASQRDFSAALIDNLSLRAHIEKLTLRPREEAVLTLFMEGCTPKECALRLGCSRQRIDQITLRLRAKLLGVDGAGKAGVGGMVNPRCRSVNAPATGAHAPITADRHVRKFKVDKADRHGILSFLCLQCQSL